MSRPATKKSEAKKLDAEWGRTIKERDGNVCAVCGKPSKVLNAHHIIPRKRKDTHYEIMNGISLCYVHHKMGIDSAHQSAVWFSLWLQKHRPEQYVWILNKLKEVEK
jgi:hypothetical protein